SAAVGGSVSRLRAARRDHRRRARVGVLSECREVVRRGGQPRKRSGRVIGVLMSTQQAIFEVLARHAQRDPAKISRDDILADIGVSSLKFIMMMLEIEKVSGRKMFDINSIGKVKTVGDILARTES